MIHPSAIIDPSAEIGQNVSIGPFSVIGAQVQIGDGCIIGSHVSILGPTRLGSGNTVYAHACLGGDPQDKKFSGEDARLEIGDGNTIREFCTFNRGTGDGGGVTRIGDRNWIMAYVHIAHDCIVGNDSIFANAASLAGHVVVDDQVILGGFTLVHQFCQIGAHAFTSMSSVINRDVPPYVTVAGAMAEPRGINTEGLRRRGFSPERIRSIKRAYKLLYMSGLKLNEARTELEGLAQGDADIALLVQFIDRSQRSLVR